MPDLAAGERWRLVVRLKRPHGYANPGGFDLEAWLLERNLRATGYVRAGEANARLDAFAGRFRDHVQRARERVRERIALALADARYAGVVAALAIGDQRAIPDDAVDGLQPHRRRAPGEHFRAARDRVRRARGLGSPPRSRAGRPGSPTRLPARTPARSRASAVAGVYTLLAGAEVPALRTFAMLATRRGGPARVAPRNVAASIWLWALAAVLALDPWAVLSPGFWLSYGAVARADLRGRGPCGPRPRVGAVRGDHRACCARARARNGSSRGLVPFTLALFGQVSLVSPVANAVAIPVVTLAVVPLALAGIVVPFDALLRARRTRCSRR